MKFDVLTDILFELLQKRKLTAKYLAEKHNLSPRTIYRYVEQLSSALPLQIKQGRQGGIYLSETYLLPVGFLSEREYETAIEALGLAYASSAKEEYLNVRRKLSAEQKQQRKNCLFSEDLSNVIVDGNGFFDLSADPEILQLVNQCITKQTMAEIRCLTDKKELVRTIEPHALILRGFSWSVYAFCHTERNFRLFSAGEIVALFITEKHFTRRPFDMEQLPLSQTVENLTPVLLEISPNAEKDVLFSLGADKLSTKDGKRYAQLSVKNDALLVRKLLSLGADVKVLSPKSIKDAVKNAAQALWNAYENE